MRFRLIAAVSGLVLHHPLPDGRVRLTVEGAHTVAVILRPQPKREQKRFPGTVRCEAEARFTPSPAVLAGFQALSANELPEGSHLPADPRKYVHEGRLVEAPATSAGFRTSETRPPSGCAASPTRQTLPDTPLALMNLGPLLPKPMRSVVDQTQRELKLAAERAVELTRWRRGEPGPHQPLGFVRTEWTVGRRWHRMPGEIHVTVKSRSIPAFTDTVVEEIQGLIDSGVAPPLAHSLFREAVEQSSSNPRSSLVIAVAALEVGVKQHLAAKLPELAWWLDETSAPPIVKILADYLAPLEGYELGQPIRDELTKAVNARNRLVHSGQASKFVGKRLQDALEAIGATLWWLDVLSGRSWAQRHVQREVAEPAPDGA